MDKALLSTGQDEWGTPQELYDELDKEFKFTLDPCSSDTNYKHPNHFTVKENGLLQNWGGNAYFATRHTANPKRERLGKLTGLKNVTKNIRKTA